MTSSYDGSVQIQAVTGKDPIFSLTVNEPVKCAEWINLGMSILHFQIKLSFVKLVFNIKRILANAADEDSLFVTGGFSQVLRFFAWNPVKKSVKCVWVGRGHKDLIQSIASSSKIPNCSANLLATGSSDGNIKIWSASQ